MHIIILPSTWSRDSDDYRQKKDEIYSKIKKETTAEVVVKVSPISKIKAIMESLNSEAFVKNGSEKLLWYGECKEFENLNSNNLELINLLLKNSNTEELYSNCMKEVQEHLSNLEEAHLKSIDLVIDMVPQEMVEKFTCNNNPFLNISPGITLHFINEIDRKNIENQINSNKNTKKEPVKRTLKTEVDTPIFNIGEL